MPDPAPPKPQPPVVTTWDLCVPLSVIFLALPVVALAAMRGVLWGLPDPMAERIAGGLFLLVMPIFVSFIGLPLALGISRVAVHFGFVRWYHAVPVGVLLGGGPFFVMDLLDAASHPGAQARLQSALNTGAFFGTLGGANAALAWAIFRWRRRDLFV